MKQLLFFFIFTINIFSEDLCYFIYDFNQTTSKKGSILYENEKVNFILDIKNKNYTNIEKFISKYEDIDFSVKDNNTPLFYAIDLDNIKVVELLVKNGANIYHINDNLETTLHIAVKGNHIEITRFLLERGIKQSSKDIYGNTPMHYAKENAFNEIIELLKYYKKSEKKEVDSLEEFIKNF